MRISARDAQAGFSRRALSNWKTSGSSGGRSVMTSMLRRLGLGLIVIAAAQISTSAASRQDAPRTAPPARLPRTYVAPTLVRPIPAGLRERVVALGRAFDGKAGIAIVSLRDGWEIGWNGNTLFPQQSCSKMWV